MAEPRPITYVAAWVRRRGARGGHVRVIPWREGVSMCWGLTIRVAGPFPTKADAEARS